MADTPEDLPPIGTAQNAADVARKAEALQAILNDSAQPLEMRTAAFAVLKTNEAVVQAREAWASALPWTDEQIDAAYAHMDRNTISGEGASRQDFIEALEILHGIRKA